MIPADAAPLRPRQVRARQLWGTDVYTEDSDLVAVLVHTGYYALPSGAGAAPPPGLTELRATLRPMPAQEGARHPPRRPVCHIATQRRTCAGRGTPIAAAFRAMTQRNAALVLASLR